MSTNDWLVDQLECYMDDLVDCFEEFIKKSMLVISVAVGTLVLMVMYILKLMSERVSNIGLTTDRIQDRTADTECFDNGCQVSIVQQLPESAANVQQLSTNTKSLINAYLPSANGTKTVSLQTIPITYPSLDDSFTKEIEMYIISKPCETCKDTQVSEDLKSSSVEYKLTTTTRQPRISKNYTSASRRSSKLIAKRNSCCSLCCENEKFNKLRS